MIHIVEDSHLRIEGLSPAWVKGLARLCSIENEAKQTAINEYVWGAEGMDDHLTLADYYKSTLSLPRGFKDELRTTLDASGYDYSFENRRVKAYSEDVKAANVTRPVLNAEQQEAWMATYEDADHQGRIIIPPGKGKTVLGLAIAQTFAQRTIILVDKKHIAQQWVNAAKLHFNTDIGFIGDNRWEEEFVTVALIQTLWSKKDELDGWWDKFGMVILDEQHHIPAETYTHIISRFPALYRYGLSATEGKSEAKKRISELVFGPILYKSTDVNVKPSVQRIETGFDYGYHPTHKVGNKTIRNNYPKMMAELTKDEARNLLIARHVDPKKCNLIVSNRINHLKAIAAICGNLTGIPCFPLTGNESLEERMEVYEKADLGNCAIFSTLGVAGEALDIPRIDAIHLAFPMKNEETVWQVIGRGTRTHPEKDSCIIYDYVDRVDVLKRQANHRLRKLYQREELKVIQHECSQC